MSDTPPYITIPTWTNGMWGETSFGTRDSYRDFVTPLFLEPGKYLFNETSFAFNEQAQIFRKDNRYNEFIKNGKDYVQYWETHKERCRRGAIFNSGSLTWYLPREYYMWLNFLQIFDKEQEKFDFAQVRDAQYHISLYNLLAELYYKHAANLKKRQIASEQPHSEPVLAEHGWSTMGKINVGERLWNPDGTLTTILYKTNNGLSDVYEFEFGDGRKVRCGIEHNWEVYNREQKKRKVVLNTKQLLEIGIHSTPIKGKKKTYDNFRFSIDNILPIPFRSAHLSVHPYLLGALLGDGHINDRSVNIAGADIQIFEEISKILGCDYVLTHGGYCRKNITYKNRFSEECKKYERGQFGCNPLLRELHQLELGIEPGRNKKFIPENYKHTSVVDRIALVQGMMDTDGYVNSKGVNIHFTNVNKRLIDDFVYVVRSLGLKVTVVTKKSKDGSFFYRVLFSGKIPFDIFRLKRKLDRFELRKSKQCFDTVPIVNIKKLLYKEESSCIVVDNPNHLYITKDFVVTHNSYLHCAKLINLAYFEEGVTLKMGAALKSKVNEEGSWKFLEEYRNFLNKNTGWYRPFNPGGVGHWEQKVQTEIGGKKITEGLKSTITMLTFDKDETAGVGGPTKVLYHEEGGIAPKADKTYRYSKQAMRSGMITTGLFITAGSVGDLLKCEPLKKFIYYPAENDFYPVTTNLLDEKGTVGQSGLFIPEQWSMPPYIDKYGNSMVPEALAALEAEFERMKKDLTPEDYQLEVSQRPRNIAEAFAYRAESRFPLHLVAAQERRITDKTYSQEFVDLYKNEHGRVMIKQSNKLPISEFPLSKKTENKEGVIVIYERPVDKPEFGMYYGTVDPVKTGRTTTSESLCSIYIYKNDTEVTRHERGETKVFIESGGIVASWCGRFDDLTKTHERLELMIELYNAWTLVENNVSQFINYMISKHKQRYLVPKSQIIFLKDIGSNTEVYAEYGWANNGSLFDEHLIPYLVAFLREELSVKTLPDGTIVKTTYGIERIPDIMVFKEMRGYEKKKNFDRLVSLAILCAFIKIQQAARGYAKRVEEVGVQPNKDQDDMYKVSVSAFRHLGKSGSSQEKRPPRNPFKNLK